MSDFGVAAGEARRAVALMGEVNDVLMGLREMAVVGAHEVRLCSVSMTNLQTASLWAQALAGVLEDARDAEARDDG